MESNKIIIFNGPPRSGKDTFADKLEHVYENKWFNSDVIFIAMRESFKDSLVHLVLDFYNIHEDEWDDRYEHSKEEPWDALGGRSQREALIDMSENKIKPMFGNDFFGKAAARKLQTGSDSDGDGRLYIFSDGGFVEEIQPLIDKFGKENILIIRLHREGFDFSNDSRGFLNIEGIESWDVDSKGIEDTFDAIKKICEEWIGE